MKSPKSSPSVPKTVSEKIQKGFYKNVLPWYAGKNQGDSRKAYQDEDARLLAVFKQDALEELGLVVKLTYYDPCKYPMAFCTGDVPNVTYKHPKADALFEKALDRTEERSIPNIWNEMCDLVELVR